MSELLIRGVEMPEGEIPLWLSISADGTVQYNRSNPSDWKTAEHKAACIPAHGRLIDTDAVSLEGGPYEYDEWCKWALEQYQDAPTVIEAEEE